MKRRFIFKMLLILLNINFLMGCGQYEGQPETAITLQEMLDGEEGQEQYKEKPDWKIADTGKEVTGKTFVLCCSDARTMLYRALEIQLKTYMKIDGNTLLIKDAKGSAELQEKQVKEVTDQGADGVFLIPVDISEAEKVVEYLEEEKVPVVLLDAEASSAKIQPVSIVADYFNAGYILGEDAGKRMDEEHATGLIFYFEKELNAKSEIYGIKEGLGNTQLERMEEIALPLEDKEAEEVVETSLGSLEGKGYIFCTNDRAGLLVLSVCDKLGIEDVHFYSIDGSDKMKRKLAEGDKRIAGLALRSPFQLSVLGMDGMYALCNGENPESKYMIETFLATEENIKNYSVDTWQ